MTFEFQVPQSWAKVSRTMQTERLKDAIASRLHQGTVHQQRFADLGRLFDPFKVSERKLDYRTGTEGPRDDKYQWDEYIVQLNGHEYKLRISALGYVQFFFDGKKQSEGFERDAQFQGVIRVWENITKINVCDFETLYCRAHPYFEDPMGSPSMYE